MRAEAERPQNEMIIVASLSRDAVQVRPTTDEVDALLAASMVALPDELLKHTFSFSDRRALCSSLAYLRDLEQRQPWAVGTDAARGGSS